jgi:DNA-binding beta-propeller fold protein YncE
MARRSFPFLVLVLAATAAGCGTPFQLPTENRQGRLLPSDHSYQMSATWDGMTDVTDLLLTQGSGTQLFLLFQHPGAGIAPRGSVNGYALHARPPVTPLPGIEFRELFNPHALCAAGGTVFVLDQGDTALARSPVDRRVADLEHYWRVKEFGLLGGDTISTFTDTSLAYVQGVAADDQGRVYVSGSAIVLIPDAQIAGVFTRAFNFRVNRYKRVAAGSGNDPYMPGSANWVRDNSFRIEEGSGLGTLNDPRGLYWAGASVLGGPALFAADMGKSWVQKLSDAQSNTAFFMIDAGQDTTLATPVDVALDLQGFIYVADRDGRRVLRYKPDGTFVQRVNVELDADHQPLTDPVAVAADDSLVYVADRAASKVVRYERRK